MDPHRSQIVGAFFRFGTRGPPGMVALWPDLPPPLTSAPTEALVLLADVDSTSTIARNRPNQRMTQPQTLSHPLNTNPPTYLTCAGDLGTIETMFDPGTFFFYEKKAKYLCVCVLWGCLEYFSRLRIFHVCYEHHCHSVLLSLLLLCTIYAMMSICMCFCIGWSFSCRGVLYGFSTVGFAV